MSKKLLNRMSSVTVILALVMGVLVTAGWTAPVAGIADADESQLAPSVSESIYLPLILNSYSSGTQPGSCLTSEEALLANMINDYRNANGLPDAPVSKSLVTVAQWHVQDLYLNNPDSGTDPRGWPCNPHSWSSWRPDLWTAVCYTDDHFYAAGMWNKPREITKNVYTGNGYENAYWTSGQATAADALSGWQSSPAHNAVILEQGMWSGANWPAMGVGIYKHYAVLWFGNVPDPQGAVGACTP